MTVKGNPVVFTYECEVSIGGPPAHRREEAQQALNRAWGFEDGKCSWIDEGGNVVGKPGSDDPGIQGAHYGMSRHVRVMIEVRLHKDGQKTFRLLRKGKP